MSITYTDNLQLLSYNNLKVYFEVDIALDSLLPKNDLIAVEGEDKPRYEHLKEQIKINGITAPFYVTGLDNKVLLIDGLTRWSIVKELVKEKVIDPSEALFNVRIYEGFNSLEEIMTWMWSFNQSTRGAIHRPKLDTIMMGIKYNLSKKAHGGNRRNPSTANKVLSSQTEHLKNTLEELSTIFDVSESSVRRAGTLVSNLYTLAGLYDRPNNSFYYLYEEGVSQAKIAKLAGIVKGSDDYRKLEKYITTKDSKAISLFITEKELKQARLEKEEKDRKHRLCKAKGANHLSNICKLYSEESLIWSHLEQIKRLERCLIKQEEKEWFFSGLKQVNNKESLTKLIIQTKQQFPLLQNNKVRTSPNSRSTKPQPSFVEREVIQQPYTLIEEELDTFDISAFDPTDKELAEKTVRTLTDLYYDLSSNPITKGLEENLNTLITLINNRLEKH